MATRGRKPGGFLTEEHRAKLANSNILNALIEHTLGKRDMKATQVTAAIALLKKVLPDLQATQISGDDDAPLKMEISWKK